MDKKTNGRRQPIPLRPNMQKQTESLSRDELRNKRKQKLIRKRKIRKVMLSFVLLLLVAAAGVVLAFTVFFKISTVTVTGSAVYPQKTVVKNCGVAVGDNLLRVSEESVAKKLSTSLPYVGTATIKKKLPSTLIIEITETREVAAVSMDGAYVLIDGDGKILDTDATLLREGVAVVEGVKAVSPKEGGILSLKDEKQEAKLLELLSAIKESGLTGLSEINLKDLSAVTMQYDFRIKIKLGAADDPVTKMKRAKAALENEDAVNPYNEGVLDLRTDPYSYFRAGKDPEETTTKASKSSKKSTNTKTTKKAS